MKKGRILIVDDDLTTTALLNAKLTEHGYDVQTANDGLEALQKSQSFQPDLIILDIMMPKMDGYTFVLEFKKFGDIKQTPIIVLTSQTEMRDIFELEGINDYIL